MKQLVSNIANGAGRCDAAFLNATLLHLVTQKTCPPKGRAGWNWTPTGTGWTPADDYSGCYTRDVQVVSNVKPAYCVSYADDQVTYLLGVHYVGDPNGDGHWVDDSTTTQ